MERTMWVKYPDGALPLFIGGGDHEVVRGCNLTSEKKLLKIQVHKEVLITTRKSPVYFRENYF